MGVVQGAKPFVRTQTRNEVLVVNENSMNTTAKEVALISQPSSVKIYSWAEGKKSGLEWDADMNEHEERRAKWDCKGNADPLIMEDGKIFAMVNGKKCGFEWLYNSVNYFMPWLLERYEQEQKAYKGELRAAWDCKGNADPLIIEDGKIYSMALDSKCGLEWDASEDKYEERKAKWDCKGNADPVVFWLLNVD